MRLAPRQTSLHERILRDVEDRIMSGAWPPGHRIPSELELAQTYECSRMTINKALTQLSRAGLVERRRRAGSFVRQPHAESAVLELHSLESEVEHLGLAYRHELASRRRHHGDTTDRDLMGTRTEDSLLELVCVHFAGDQPFCLERRLINLTAVPEAEAADFASEAPGAWLIRKVPWSEAEHKISAIEADDAVARHLAIAPGSACLSIDRRTWSNDRVVTRVRLIYPGKRHSLVARFTPSQ